MTPSETTTPPSATAATAAAPVDSERRHMKAQLGTGLPGKQSGDKEKYFVNEVGVEKTIGEDAVAMTDTLYFKNCKDVTYTLQATCTKLFVEGCDHFTLHVQGRVITQMIEVWKCNNVHVQIDTRVQTVQLDLCQGATVAFKSRSDFTSLVWSGVNDLNLTFADSEEHSLSTGIDLIAAENKKIQPETDQFIVRLVPHKVTGHLHLLNELVVRLNNGFPTTEREARLFEERQEANLQKLAKELLGADIQIGKKKDQGPKVKPNEPCKCGSGKKYKKCCGTNVL